MIELVIHHLSIGQLTLRAERQEELLRAANLWLSIPEACPICGAATTVTHRHVRAKKGDNAGEEFDYYQVVCRGTPVHDSKLGQYKAGGLFYTGEWAEAMYQPQTNDAAPIGDKRAVGMHAALERAGVDKPTAFARGVLGKDVSNLGDLTESEAADVWAARPK
jgi:hypothetical protein